MEPIMSINGVCLDPEKRPTLGVNDLSLIGFGHEITIRTAIKQGRIPNVGIGRTIQVPTAWVRRTLQLDNPAPVG
jgi:hypothetical protein